MRIHRDTGVSGSDRAGVALLTALGLLMLFSLLGTVYIRYMVLENENTDLDLRLVRARETAANGVYAALAEMTAARREARPCPPSLEFKFPVYRTNRRAPLGFDEHEGRLAQAKVAISDESGKVNLNHAPAPILEALLGIDAAAAAHIIDNLPKPGEEEANWGQGGSRVWLFSLEDLVARGWLDAAKAKAVNTNLISFVNVANHADPAGYLNVNAAPAEVIAVVLGVSADVAQQVVAAKPYASLAQLGAAAGKDPSTFPLPAAWLGFSSACYRIESAGVYANVFDEGRIYKRSHRGVDAMVVFDASGTPSIRQWAESTGRLDSEEGTEAETTNS